MFLFHDVVFLVTAFRINALFYVSCRVRASFCLYVLISSKLQHLPTRPPGNPQAFSALWDQVAIQLTAKFVETLFGEPNAHKRNIFSLQRSRKPKESNGSDDGPSAKKLRQDVKASSSPTTSKTSSSNLKPTGYRFQDVSILQRVLLASAVCKACSKGSLHLFERPSGCGMARTLVLQCANNACRAFTELPTSEKIVSGKARFYDINRRSPLVRASLTKFCAVMNMPGPVAKKSCATHVK